MANWLERLLPPPKGSGKSTQLPVVGRKRPVAEYGRSPLSESSKVPNASLIYGVGASVLMVMSLYFLFQGQWFTALVIMFPAICLFAFAMYFVRHASR